MHEASKAGGELVIHILSRYVTACHPSHTIILEALYKRLEVRSVTKHRWILILYTLSLGAEQGLAM